MTTMRSLAAPDLLRVWEAGQTLSLPQRALALLIAAHTDAPADTLARLTIGERDARLLDLREQCFGGEVVATATCPACGQRNELNFTTAGIRAPAAGSADEFVIRIDDGDLHFRAVNALDLIEVADEAHTGVNLRWALAERCLTRADEMLTEAKVDAIARHLSEVDSQAEVALSTTCPSCGHAWTSVFDIAAFFWSEIDAWAQRLLDDVHLLASAYGWREDDIVRMSAWRRQQYLQRMGV